MSSSVFLKLFENCLLLKMEPYITINDRQHGFRKNYSTSTACYILKETVLNYTRYNSNVYSCFIDFSKAFDLVNHDILINKLSEMGIPQCFINVIKFWYCNQLVKVKYGDSFSNEWRLNNGVRQGGVLSGLFFSIYINSLIDKIAESNIGCMLGIVKANIIVYADDIVLLAPSKSALQSLVDICLEKSNELELSFNCRKTKTMVFTCKTSDPIMNDFLIIKGQRIENVKSVKYLGYMISYDLNNHLDKERVIKKFYAESNQILRKFHFVDKDIKVLLFKQYCTQFYGADLWFGNKKLPMIKQFAIAFHKTIKKILGLSTHESNHFACQEANILMFEHFLNRMKIFTIFRFLNRPCNFVQKAKPFLIISSVMLTEVLNILVNAYEVDSLFQNDLNAINSRIIFTQNHEPQMRTSW